MKFKFTGRHIEFTDSLKEYVQEKMTKLQKKYLPEKYETKVNVIIEVLRGIHQVEINLDNRGDFFRAEEKSADMYASIDKVVDVLDKQLRRFYDKRIESRRQSKKAKKSPKIEKLQTSLKNPNGDNIIVNKQMVSLKPMSIEEALLQMNSLDYNFFVFIDSGTEKVSVIYRRADKTIGLIEP